MAFESELKNVFKMISTCLNDSFEFKWFMPYVSSFKSAKKKTKKKKEKKVAIISFINSWISNNSRTAAKNIKKDFFCFLLSNILPFRFVVHYFRGNMFFVHEQSVMVRVKGGSWTNRGKNGPLKKRRTEKGGEIFSWIFTIILRFFFCLD